MASPRAQAVDESLQVAHTVTGTVAILDLSKGKGMLKTDLDKPIFFKIGRPDHFQGLSIGDRVTMQLDEEGRTVKVIKALPAELHEPPPPAQ
jgi:cold shock CspA family protein